MTDSALSLAESTPGQLLDRVSGLSVDELRCLLGRLEDADRLVRAVLRQQLQRLRRQTGETMQLVGAAQ